MEGVWAKTSIAAQIRHQVQAGGSRGADLESEKVARVASTSEECSPQAVDCAKVERDKWTTAKTLVTGMPLVAKGCTGQKIPVQKSQPRLGRVAICLEL